MVCRWQLLKPRMGMNSALLLNSSTSVVVICVISCFGLQAASVPAAPGLPATPFRTLPARFWRWLAVAGRRSTPLYGFDRTVRCRRVSLPPAPVARSASPSLSPDGRLLYAVAAFAHAPPLPDASGLYVPGRCSRSLLARRRSGFPAFERRSTTVDNLPARRRTVRLYDREPDRDRQWWNA